MTQISMTNGQQDKFTYDSNGNLSQIDVSLNGKNQTLKPNADGTWNGFTPDGKAVSDVGVTGDGALYYKGSDGKFAVVSADGKPVALDDAANKAIDQAAQPYEEVTVKKGEGTLRVAGRVLGISNTDDPKVVALSDAIQKSIGTSDLLINQKIDLSKIDDPSLVALRSKAEQDAVTKALAVDISASSSSGGYKAE